MITIFVESVKTGERQYIETWAIDIARITWDAIEASGKYVMLSQRP